MPSDAPPAPTGVFHALVQNMRDAVVTVGTDGRIEYANPSAATLFGLGDDDVVGRELVDLVPEDHRAATLAALDPESGASSLELTITAAGGDRQRHLVTASTVEDDDHALLRCLVFSEPARGQSADRAQIADAAQAARAERQQVAHEVNDTIVQGLVAAEMALDLGRVEFARLLIARTSAHARHWIGELAGSEQLEPGMAVRSGPARGGIETP